MCMADTHSKSKSIDDEKTAKVVESKIDESVETKAVEKPKESDKKKEDGSWFKLGRKEKNEILAKEGTEYI